jgi:hypothetical protein
MPTQSFGNCHAGQLPLPLTRERPALTYPDRIIGPGRSLSRPSDMAAQEEARVNPRIGREIHGMRPDDRGHHRDGHRLLPFPSRPQRRHQTQDPDHGPGSQLDRVPGLEMLPSSTAPADSSFHCRVEPQWRRLCPAMGSQGIPGHFKTRPLQDPATSRIASS